MWSESIEVLNPYEAVMAGIIRKAAEKEVLKAERKAKRRAMISKLFFWRNK